MPIMGGLIRAIRDKCVVALPLAAPIDMFTMLIPSLPFPMTSPPLHYNATWFR